MVKRIPGKYSRVHFCYEAGPTATDFTTSVCQVMIGEVSKSLSKLKSPPSITATRARQLQA
jgi:hypothetical protein